VANSTGHIYRKLSMHLPEFMENEARDDVVDAFGIETPLRVVSRSRS